MQSTDLHVVCMLVQTHTMALSCKYRPKLRTCPNSQGDCIDKLDWQGMELSLVQKDLYI